MTGVCQVILGQGYPAVPSRFLDPREPKNNVWRPSSVPAVKAQPWWWNYRNGLCGVRKLNDDLSVNDSLLEQVLHSSYKFGSQSASQPASQSVMRRNRSVSASLPRHVFL